jgi:hypothetical protein
VAIKQGRLFDPSSVTMRQFEPPAWVAEGAKRFASERGMEWNPEGLDNMRVDPQRGHAQYLAYRDSLKQAQAGQESPEIRPSYHAMRSHLNDQYDFLTRPQEAGGMGVKVEVTPHDPYPDDPAGMAKDLDTNRRIQVMSTATTGSHEFFADSENDKFRAVHDVFGHVATGRGFSRDGEEAAYRSHRQMFPASAHGALTSETRGQNSWLNYGPGGFASQEGAIVGLPRWAQEDGPLPEAPRGRGRGPRPQQLAFPGV